MVEPRQTLRASMRSEPALFDPAQGADAATVHMQRNLFDGITDIDENGEIVPGLAESWTVSGDGLVYTFTMRAGVKFHDGTDFDAGAAKFNLDRSIELNQTVAGILRPVTSVEAPDKQTLVVTLEAPTGRFLLNMAGVAGLMSSPAAIQKYGGNIIRNPTGAGPFEFVEWLTNDRVVMKRFDDYWGDKALVDEIVWRPVPDENARVVGLLNGNTEFIDAVPAKDLDILEADSEAVLFELPAFNFRAIFLQNSEPPFDSVDLRLALAHSIDRKAIIESVLFGRVEESFGPLGPDQWAYDPAFKAQAFDEEASKAALARAGRPDGFSFEMIVIATSAEEQIGQIIKTQAEAANIEITIAPVKVAGMIDAMITQTFTAIQRGDAGLSAADPDEFMYNSFTTEGFRNRGSYSNPEVDEILLEAQQTLDRADRIPLYRRAQKIISEEAAMVFINTPYGPSLVAMSPKLKGFVSPDNRYDFRKAFLEE